jgi:cytochrome c-type biogenesis protein CcmH/NrfG
VSVIVPIRRKISRTMKILMTGTAAAGTAAAGTCPKLCAVILACALMSMTAWSLEAASPAATAAAKRDAARCLAQSNVDACNDAIRRNPGDPKLLVALADGLMRAKRPADAIRHYRRAAALAPHLPGVAAKLSAAERQLAAEQSAAPRRVVRAAPHAAPRAPVYTNAAPETQSH